MKNQAGWSLLGRFDPKARTSFFGLALAIYIAAETFGTHGHRYKVLMCFLILASAVLIGKKAINASSILGIATALLSLVWIAPIFNENIFYNLDLSFMLAHSFLSLAIAVGAFSYLKN